MEMPPGWEMSRVKGTNRAYFINHKDHTTTWEDPRIAYYTKKGFCTPGESDTSESDETATSEFRSPDVTCDEDYVKPRCDEIPADFQDDSRFSLNSSRHSSNSEDRLRGLRALPPSSTDRSTPCSRAHRSQRSRSERAVHERIHLSTRSSLRSERSTSKHWRRVDESHEDEPMKPLMESEEDQRALSHSETPEQKPEEDQTVASEVSTQAQTAEESPKSDSDETSVVPMLPALDHTRATLAVGPNPALRSARVTARGPDPSLRRGDDVCLAKGPNPSLHRGPNPQLLGRGVPASVRSSSLVLAR